MFSKLIYFYKRNHLNIDTVYRNSGFNITELMVLESFLINGDVESFKSRAFNYKSRKESKFIKIYYFHLVIAYFNLIADEFNSNRFLYEISKIDLKLSEFLNEYYNSKHKESRLSVYNEYKNDLLKFYKKYPFLDDIIISLYLTLYLTDAKILKNKTIENKILNIYKNVANKKEINNFQQQKIYILALIIDDYYLIKKICENDFFISLNLLKNLLYNSLEFINSDDFKIPSNFSNRINILYNLKNTIFSLEIRNNNYKNEEDQKYENLFHKFKQFLDISNATFEEILVNNLIDIVKFNNKLDKFKNSPIPTSIFDFIITIVGISFRTKQVNEVKVVLENRLLEVEKSSEFELYIKLSLELINFWLNKPSDFSNPRYKIPNIIELIWRFEKKMITFEELLVAIQKSDKCYSLNFHNWKKINEVFNDEILPELLLKLLTKIIPVKNDVEIVNFINKFLFDMITLNRYKNLFLKDFLELSNFFVLTSNYNIKTIYYIYISLINMYHYTGDEITIYSNILIDRFNELSLDNTENDVLISNMIINVSNLLDSNIVTKLSYLTERLIDNQLKVLNRYYLELIFDFIESILKKEDIKELFNLHKGDKEIQDIVYSLVVQIAQKMIINKRKLIKIFDFDTVYLFDNKFFALIDHSNEDLKYIYDYLNISIINNVSDEYEKISLTGIIIQKIYFKYIEEFEAGYAITFEEKLEPKQIIDKMSKVLGFEDRKVIIENIVNGNDVDQPWLNIFDAHKLFKLINGLNSTSYMFKNVITQYLPTSSILLSFSSLVLLSKLGILDKISRLDNIYITNSSYEVITDYSNNDIFHFEDVVEGFVFYKELIDNLKIIVDNLFDNGRVIDFSNENLLPDLDLSFINKFDREVFNFIIYKTYSNQKFTIINEDPYFYKIFKNTKTFQSTLSLLLYLFQVNLIDTDYLYEKINLMKKINYRTTIEGEALSFLILNTDNNNVDRLISLSNS